MFRTLALFACCSLSVAGCRNDNPFNPVDLAMPGGDMGGNGNDMAVPGDGGTAVKCTTGYMDTTVAAMRTAAKSGCFKVGAMAPVVALAFQGTSTHATMVVQDSAGGDSSAFGVDCDSRSKSVSAGYGCTILSSFTSAAAGHGVTVAGFYVHTTAGLEFFNVIDTFTDSGTAGTKPAPLALTLANLAHGNTADVTSKQEWQFATVAEVTGAATLSTFDYAPAEFKPTTAPTACTQFPYTFGFGLIKTSISATATPSCVMGGSAMQATTPNAAEILIDTSFYSGFKLSSDCMCAMTANLITANETFTKLQGIVKLQGTAPSLAPLVNADLGK